MNKVYQYLKFSLGNCCGYGAAVTVFRREDAGSRLLKKYIPSIYQNGSASQVKN
jgi:hypothetical protein